MVPDPETGAPMDGVELLQLQTVLLTGPETGTAAVLLPLQYCWLLIGYALGVGFTIILNEVALPVHVSPRLVNDELT